VNRNNFIFGLVIVIFVAFLTLFFAWGSYSQSFNTLSVPISIPVVTTGMKGFIGLNGVRIPHVVLILLLSAVALTQILNLLKKISLSVIFLYVVNVFVFLWLSWGAYLYMQQGEIQIGLVAMLADALFLLVLILFSSRAVQK
jgi:hypothetical protein